MGGKQRAPAAGHRFFDHTGDFGVELHGPDPAALAAELARAYLELFTDAPASVAEREAREVRVSGIDEADLLVALGNELIYLFEVEKLLVARFEPGALEPGALSGVVHGERFDPARHPIARPVKAVTHHGARCEPHAGGWRARLVFDL
jgi:SHS2 domain-containing protein